MSTETSSDIARTFDELSQADLEQVYLHGKTQVLRGRAFKILLDHANTVPQLEQLAFGGEHGLDGWATDELLELSNRFRLLSSPENEIRLYRETRDITFRNSDRVREFYILALNRIGRPAEAIEEALRIIASGSHNALIWGMLGDSYSARMIFAEQLLDSVSSTLDSAQAEALPRFFPDLPAHSLTPAHLHTLRQSNLEQVERVFQQGFRETGASFCGLGWMLRTVDRLADAAIDMETGERLLRTQSALVAAALEMEGGAESLDYWTHAGRVELAVLRAESTTLLHACLERAITTVDARFKLAITLGLLDRLCDKFERIRQNTPQNAAQWETRVALAKVAMNALNAAQLTFDQHRPSQHSTTRSMSETPFDDLLRKTINFRALIGNLVPLTIEGTIGRVGARVPDLIINRRVRNDLLDFLEDKIIRALPAAERDDPHAVISRIQEVVGQELRLADLQDLQSTAHAAFDARSDGLIALSGADLDMRKDTRTSTDLTAALLMQTGDCRETMYLNGALFACWQQMQVRRQIDIGLLCMSFGYWAGVQHIIDAVLPKLLRYQLRGGQAGLFVEGIEVLSKYHCRQSDNGVAYDRPYGLAELRAAVPLNRYQLESSRIEVTYQDGSTAWLQPKDSITGKPRPLQCTQREGVPDIPNAGQDFANVRSIHVLNLVEDHAMTFLFDTTQGSVELRDGFYNERLFNSPYPFSCQPVDLAAISAKREGFFRIAQRALLAPDGTVMSGDVHLNFLRFSRTDYVTGLNESDLPGKIKLMGRTFDADFKVERRRMDAGQSPLPKLLERIQDWLTQHVTTAADESEVLNRQLARLMLDLAKGQSTEEVQFLYAAADTPLIHEATENNSVYLVLSGALAIYKGGQALLGKNGQPQIVSTGGVVGEISALVGGLANATVQGRAAVLSISKQVIQRHLGDDTIFRQGIERLVQARLT